MILSDVTTLRHTRPLPAVVLFHSNIQKLTTLSTGNLKLAYNLERGLRNTASFSMDLI